MARAPARESGAAQYDPMMNYTGKINDWTKAVHRPMADREIQARGRALVCHVMTVMATSSLILICIGGSSMIL